MEISYIRSSSYSAYDFCQLKYYINYNLGLSEPSGKKATLGTIVHKVMELLAICKLSLQNNRYAKKISDDGIGEVVFSKKKIWEGEFIEELTQRSFDLYTKGSPHAYALADYKFVQKSIAWVLDSLYDPRKQEILKPESHFDMKVEGDWNTYNLTVKGTIDLVVKVDEETVQICDYKTGKRLNWSTGKEKTYEDLEGDFQLLLYYYVVSKMYPGKDVMVSIIYMNDGGIFTMLFDHNNEAVFMKKIQERFLEIRDCKNPQPRSYNRSDFRCTRMCHFYKNNFPGSDRAICYDIDDSIKKNGIEKTTELYKIKDFSVNYYHAPGQAE